MHEGLKRRPDIKRSNYLSKVMDVLTACLQNDLHIPWEEIKKLEALRNATIPLTPMNEQVLGGAKRPSSGSLVAKVFEPNETKHRRAQTSKPEYVEIDHFDGFDSGEDMPVKFEEGFFSVRAVIS